jgi:hypothetical protein
MKRSLPAKPNSLSVLSPDKDAAAIGDLYRKARGSLVDSVRFAIACGKRLKAKQDSLKHGEWLPWLRDNADVLRFDTPRTAQMLMKLAANTKLPSHLDEAGAVAISRELWGHKDSQLIQQSLSSEHYTPRQYLDAARDVLSGSIDLDPASCPEANRIVRAKRFFSMDDDGLTQPWHGTVWLNPPYGRRVGDFIAKFIAEYDAGRVEAGVVLVNAHCTDTDWFQLLWRGLLCFTDHRINFYGDDERSGSTHGSVFAYFGERRDAFVEAFSQFGTVVAKIAARKHHRPDPEATP